MALTIKEAVRKWGQEYLAICGLAKYFPTMNSQSHVFFVDGNSDKGNDGVNTLGQVPEEPFLTVTQALSKCTSKANDYIFILNYPSTAPAETWPISIGKERVHILGIHQGIMPHFKVINPQDTDNPVFVFTTGGAYCELGYMIMGCSNGSAKGTIEMQTGGLFGNHIHHCGFGLWGKSNSDAAFGICTTGGSTPTIGEMLYSVIEHCKFGSLLTTSGIQIPDTFKGPNTVKGTIIRNNHFATGVRSINVLATTADFASGGIYNNTFEVPDSADGEAVYFANGAQGSVHKNYAWTVDGAVPAQNPFFDADHAGTPTMGWGMNFRGPGDVATDTLRGTGAIAAPDDN